MFNRMKVVLMLARLSVPQKVEKARSIASAMTGNAHFASPYPPLAQVTGAAGELEQAAIAAALGGKDETAVMREKEAVLDRLLTNEGFYVEIIANDTPAEAESIILSAGMSPKKARVSPAMDFRAKHGEVPGQAKLRTRYVQNAAFFWQYKVSGAAEWVNAPQTNKASLILEGLTSATTYSFRVAVLKGGVLSGWSDVVELVVL